MVLIFKYWLDLISRYFLFFDKQLYLQKQTENLLQAYGFRNIVLGCWAMRDEDER